MCVVGVRGNELRENETQGSRTGVREPAEASASHQKLNDDPADADHDAAVYNSAKEQLGRGLRGALTLALAVVPTRFRVGR